MDPLRAEDPSTIGGYRLRARLGEGGMGQVYLAVSPGGRQVAVKVIRSEFSGDPGFRERFAREVAAARAVSGAFTAPVIDADVAADPAWLVTAYVPGPSLAKSIAESGPLPLSAVWSLAAGLAEALLAVHRAGLVHRDLKPSNILLAADGPRVIDFGIVRAVDASVLTRAGAIVGTPAFMSPEQIQGRPVGPESDVFSLGAVLVYAVTGEPPFGQDSLAAVAYQIMHSPPAVSAVAEPLRSLLLACLAKDPADRPSPADLLSEIQRITGVADRPATLSTSSDRPASAPVAVSGTQPQAGPVGRRPRKKWPMALVAVGVVAILAGGAVLWSLNSAGRGDSGNDPYARCGGGVEEFAGARPAKGWKAPSSGWSINAGKLSISADDGADLRGDMTAGISAPMLSHEVKGDFTFETKVEALPRYSYQSAGLFLEVDEGNYVRLERGYAAFGAIVFEYAIKGRHVKVRSPFDEARPQQPPIKTTASGTALRLVRKGTNITATWRISDAPGWRYVGSVSFPSNQATVAVTVLNRSQKPNPDPQKRAFAANFDYARLTC